MSDLRHWLAAEPFALGMSSGFFGFFAHTGVLDALEDAGITPNRVSGSSAGALVAGVWAAGLSSAQLGEELLALRRSDFWDPWPGAGFLRGRRFRRKLEDLLPARDFADCRVPLTMSVHELWKGQSRVLDDGPLAPAIHASCAVPLMFHPVKIEGRAYVDGGVSDRPGILGVPKGQRLLFHHLASRSPWRKKNSASLQIPKRDNMVALVIEGLPRVSPFRLDAGRDALQRARAATQRALSEPVVDGKVVIRL